ncbi:hypothetical protein EZV62_000495 [Acer yangbiense]|uniref:Cyclin C-terminal domain-containing protein n=1 Tax=Acer yangbiense TaxID=1000413 RepID=A0A5C7IU38_9ROSI|nr:hypothetical protein EZV62_000495 [Acer yangbiense]
MWHGSRLPPQPLQGSSPSATKSAKDGGSFTGVQNQSLSVQNRSSSPAWCYDGVKPCENDAALKERAIEIIVRAHNEIKLIEFKPSIIAASALLLSSHELFPLQFSAFKASISSCEYEKLLKCFDTMQEMVEMEEGFDSMSMSMSSSTRTPVSVLDYKCSSKSSVSQRTTTTTAVMLLIQATCDGGLHMFVVHGGHLQSGKMEAGSAADPENPAPTIQLPEIDNSGSTADLENPAPIVQLPEIDNSGSTADLENPAPTVQLPEIDNSGSSADLENPAPTVQLPEIDNSVSSRLRKAAQNGKWEEAASLIHDAPSMAVAVITDEYENALHVATGANQAVFVMEIIKRMEPEHLEMRDGNENTALTIAVIAGNYIDIAEVLVYKNRKLLEIKDSRSMTPLHTAVLLGKNDMAVFLYDKSTESKATDYLTFEDRIGLFFQSIKSDLYDLALKLVKDRPVLAVFRDRNEDTALHLLARKPSSIFVQLLINSARDAECVKRKLETVDVEGDNPLRHTARGEHIIRLLLASGASSILFFFNGKNLLKGLKEPRTETSSILTNSYGKTPSELAESASA